MRPPFFLFGSCPKRKNAPRPVEERKRRLSEWATQGLSEGRRRPNVGQPCAPGCPLPLWCTDRSAQKHAPAARRPETTHSASRDPERATLCVRSTGERQRYAGQASTRFCFSGDPGFALGLPCWAEESRGNLLWSSFFEGQETFLSAKGKKSFLKYAAYRLWAA